MQSLALDIVFAILISDFDNKMKAAPEKIISKTVVDLLMWLFLVVITFFEF